MDKKQSEIKPAEGGPVTENAPLGESLGGENVVEEEESHSAITEIYEEFPVTSAIGEGSELVEGFSPHGTAEFVNGNTPHIADKIIYYIMSAVYLGVGLTCIFAAEQVIWALPYIVGSFMLLLGVVQFILAIKNREYRQTKSNKTAGSLVLVGLAVMILLEREWASSFIPIVWGVIGLFEGAHALNHAFARISGGMRCSYFIIKGVIELVLAFLLLYEPVHHITLHVVVFGANLVLDAITMLPVVKKFAEGRGGSL